MFKYDYTVFIGRFMPFHAAHYEVVKEALAKSKELIIVLGSKDASVSIRNPFTDEDRFEIIKSALTEDELKRVHITSVQDHCYNDDRWIGEITGAVNTIINRKWRSGPTSIALIGLKKDESSYYLNLFPTWKSIDVEHKLNSMSATDIRNEFFDKEDLSYGNFIISRKHFDTVKEKFNGVRHLIDDYDEVVQNLNIFGEGPFIAVDSLVTQSGYILLIERDLTGAGLWALPGGFVDKGETLLSAKLRELREETKLKIPEKVLRGSIVKEKIYDMPWRSYRSHIITHVSHFQLQPGKLPKVSGGDDARKARWIAIDDFKKMRSSMFEDHFDIINDMLGI